MKAKIRIATGPDYEFLEVEGTAEEIPKLLELQQAYGVKPIRRASKRVKLVDFFGQEYWYNEERHEYSNEAGEIYKSSSYIAENSVKPFDQAAIAKVMAAKPEAKLSAAEYIALWTMKADISKGLGTAVHAAVEMQGRYGVAHDNPLLTPVVKQYFAKLAPGSTDVISYEVVVIDHEAHRASRIDILIETPDGYTIRDLKTDVNIEKNLPRHQVQLNVSRQILEAHALQVSDMFIDHLGANGWTTYNLEKEQV